jgi:peptidoglycan/LPS O-acetylase OafA/YrhL
MARATINSLTGLRGIAAMWVATFHGFGMLPLDPAFPSALRNSIQCGWVAVDLFFVLSGYVMCYVHLGDFRSLSWPSTWHFWKLRLARIYPAHLVMTLAWLPVLLLAIVLFPATLTPSVREQFSGIALITALTLTNGWGLPHSQGWNGVSWSVGSEWFAYLTFPVLAVLLNRTWTRSTALMLAGGSMLVPFVLALVINHGEQFMLPWNWAIVRVETAFILGCAIYLINQRAQPQLSSTVLLIASVILIPLIVARGAPGLEIGALILCFAVLIASLARSPKVGDSVFGSHLLVFLGKISYSIYLSHYLVLVVLRHVSERFVRGGPSLLRSSLMLVVYLAIVVTVGYWLFRAVEDPARRVLRRVWIGDAELAVGRASGG